MNRRELLEYGATSLALGFGTAMRPAQARTEARWVVMCDRRHTVSLRFANIFRARGAQVFDVEGDVMRLWRKVLRTVPRGETLQFAGLTEYSELLVMRGNGREHGLKLRLEAAHESRNGAPTHTLRRRDPERFTSPLLVAQDACWPETLASRILASPQTRFVQPGRNAAAPDTARFSLHSWVIA